MSKFETLLKAAYASPDIKATYWQQDFHSPSTMDVNVLLAPTVATYDAMQLQQILDSIAPDVLREATFPFRYSEGKLEVGRHLYTEFGVRTTRTTTAIKFAHDDFAEVAGFRLPPRNVAVTKEAYAIRTLLMLYPDVEYMTRAIHNQLPEPFLIPCAQPGDQQAYKM